MLGPASDTIGHNHQSDNDWPPGTCITMSAVSAVGGRPTKADAVREKYSFLATVDRGVTRVIYSHIKARYPARSRTATATT